MRHVSSNQCKHSIAKVCSLHKLISGLQVDFLIQHVRILYLYFQGALGSAVPSRPLLYSISSIRAKQDYSETYLL